VRDPETFKKKGSDAVFVPTPPDVVVRMLELANVKKEDLVYDLGSGDGRVVIEAAKKYRCKAVGVEIEADLVTLSRNKAKESGVENLVRFVHDDLFKVDFSEATVVALYILPEMMKKLMPQLNKLSPGSRVVTHNFPIPGVKPDRTVKVTSEDDDIERPLYLYIVPIKNEKLGDR
jgi:SAM-dependent methyltransferase